MTVRRTLYRSLLRKGACLDSEPTLRALLPTAAPRGGVASQLRVSFPEEGLYRPGPGGGGAAPRAEVRAEVRSAFRRAGGGASDAAFHALRVLGAVTDAHPLPRHPTPLPDPLPLARYWGGVRQGDVLVAHPALADRPLGGAVALVLRHSRVDSLALVLNMPAPTGALAGTARRPGLEHPANMPAELRLEEPMWGGPHPAPGHFLHRVPLLPAEDAPKRRQTQPWSRLTQHQVADGLWCSFVDGAVRDAAVAALSSRTAAAEDFGIFTGMIGCEPGALDEMCRLNYWLPLRPTAASSDWCPAGGFRGPGEPWRTWAAAVQGLGPECAEWAGVDWQTCVADLRQRLGNEGIGSPAKVASVPGMW